MKIKTALVLLSMVLFISSCCCLSKKSAGTCPLAQKAKGKVEAKDFIGLTFTAVTNIENVDQIRSYGIGGGYGNGQPIADFVATEKYTDKYGKTIEKGQEFVIGDATVLENTDGYGNSGTKLILNSGAPHEGLVFWCYGFNSAGKSFWAIDKEQTQKALDGYFTIK